MPPRKAATPPQPLVPRPGKIFDPVARALDVIGDRWTLVLIRQLIGGPRGFSELRQRTGIAPRVLSSRLRQLTSDGFVETIQRGGRAIYGVTERGRSFEPIIAALARWWIHHGIQDLEIDITRFDETSPQSILEALPFLLREERARGVDLVFEIRLDGQGGGVWTVAIHDGRCEVHRGFAERAQVRYTADARAWCGVALGVLDAREAVKRGLMTKDGDSKALDHYFHRVSSLGGPSRHRSAAASRRS